MPSTPRKRTATSGTRSTRSSAAEPTARGAAAETAAQPAPAGQQTAGPSPRQAGRGVGSTVGAVVTMPFAVARSVAEDVVSTARRPDALLYWGGLVGMAALGVLEWPVAAAAGVGVAVANGVRRSRA
jgi:hypothetical protein